ncbi:hypothetical protein DP116_03775 [Brasilonema bromeliae SPC951]|uniref:Uncharacterized protein n=1 Tax=Brasilonema bromeliae SPC951 TaxID=385972 RepID=A0ABX1P2P4_9CYAN|nr:hypothetical protein [Brasilonema bromeliae SPC951]
MRKAHALWAKAVRRAVGISDRRSRAAGIGLSALTASLAFKRSATQHNKMFILGFGKLFTKTQQRSKVNSSY